MPNSCIDRVVDVGDSVGNESGPPVGMSLKPSQDDFGVGPCVYSHRLEYGLDGDKQLGEEYGSAELESRQRQLLDWGDTGFCCDQVNCPVIVIDFDADVHNSCVRFLERMTKTMQFN